MSDLRFARHWVVFSCAAAACFVALAPAQAQTAGAPARSASAGMHGVGRAAKFAHPLVRTARLLAGGQPVKIVALGSSSTYGAGASTSAASYPSRLGGGTRPGCSRPTRSPCSTAASTATRPPTCCARLDSDVIAEKPDLVLWQVGTNSVLRDKAVLPHASLLHEGLARLKAIGADIVLIDPQYAPKVIAKPNAEGMVSLIATAAKAEHVCLFHRFELMRQLGRGRSPAVRDLPVARRAAHERLELRLPRQVARRGDRRGGDASGRDGDRARSVGR